MDEMTGIAFCVGMAVYYLLRRLSAKQVDDDDNLDGKNRLRKK